MTMNTNKRKFIVSMYVEGRVDVEVEAENEQESFELAETAFMDADLTKMEFIDAFPIDTYDVEKDKYTDAK